MSYVIGNDIGKEVSESLGIDVTNVKGVVINIHADSVVTMDVTYYIPPTNLERFLGIFKSEKTTNKRFYLTEEKP